MNSRVPYCRNTPSQLGEISLQISRLMDDTDLDINPFINTIRFNSELSAAIIQIANRSYYGFTGEIDCLSRAVRMLGIGQLYYIVNSIRNSRLQPYRQYLKPDNNDPGKIENLTEMRQAG